MRLDDRISTPRMVRIRGYLTCGQLRVWRVMFSSESIAKPTEKNDNAFAVCASSPTCR